MRAAGSHEMVARLSRKTNVVHHHRQVARSATCPDEGATGAYHDRLGRPRPLMPWMQSRRDPTDRVPAEPPASLLQPERLPHPGNRLAHTHAAIDVNGLQLGR